MRIFVKKYLQICGFSEIPFNSSSIEFFIFQLFLLCSIGECLDMSYFTNFFSSCSSEIPFVSGKYFKITTKPTTQITA